MTSDALREMESWLTDRIAKLVHADPRSIAPDEPFTRHGLDSLDTVSLVLDLEELLKVELPTTLLWDHPTIRDCSAYLVEATSDARGLQLEKLSVSDQEGRKDGVSTAEREGGLVRSAAQTASATTTLVQDDTEIKIERVLVADVVEFAQRYSTARPLGGDVPISKLRAAAHAANPHAESDDVALLVAMRRGICIGYVGFMPGFMRSGGELKKIYFYSTWYAGEEGQRLGVGGMLLRASLSLGYDIVGADLAEETADYYVRLQFHPLGPLRYFQMSFDRFDPLGTPWQLLRRRLWLKGRSIRPLDKVFLASRWLTKAAFYRSLAPALSRRFRDLEFREVSDLPSDASAGQDKTEIGFHRDAVTVRWALAHPWVTADAQDATPGFAFSDRREYFRYTVVEVRSKAHGDCLGHLLLSISRERDETTVKVLDRFVPSADLARIIVAAGLEYATRYRADRVQLPEQCTSHLAQSRLARLVFRPRRRLYYCFPKRQDSVLPRDLSRIRLDFCDGDAPFT